MASSKVLPRDFYERNTLSVATALIGKILVRKFVTATSSGMIVETEAYGGKDDPASHAFRGRTPRNSLMFSRGGLAYVYFVYGANWCLNATTEAAGVPGAVLIRAIEPLTGQAYMKRNRGIEDRFTLTNGPGKLTRAMWIDGDLNGVDLTKRESLFIVETDEPEDYKIVSGPRIGVSVGQHLPWRRYILGNRFVSRGNRRLSVGKRAKLNEMSHKD